MTTPLQYTYQEYLLRFNLLSGGKDTCIYRKWRYGIGATVDRMSKMDEMKFGNRVATLNQVREELEAAFNTGDQDEAEGLTWALTDMCIPLLIGKFESEYNVQYDWGMEL